MENLWRRLIKATNGKLFSVTFVKKNNEERTLIGRVGVTKYLRGGELPYNPAAHNLLPVYDFQKKDYRTINLSTIKAFKCGKIKI